MIAVVVLFLVSPPRVESIAMKCNLGWGTRLRAAAAAAAICAAGLLSAATSRGETFSVEKDDAGVAVKIDGKLFTKYLIKVGTKQILWPIVVPTASMRQRRPGPR